MFYPHEKSAGPSDLPNIDLHLIDACRKRVHNSYESFLRARIDDLERSRPMHWQRDYTDTIHYEESIRPMRHQLQDLFGFWMDPADRAPLKLREEKEFYSDSIFTARRVWFDILPGLETYAIDLIPRKENGGGLIIQHGYHGTPEFAIGFLSDANGDDYSYRSLGLRAVQRGYRVIAVMHPSGYGRSAVDVGTLPDFPDFPCYGKNRLHRLATLGGRTLFGLDMMGTSRGVDILVENGFSPNRIGMYGLSQGGQSALFMPALDIRIQASICSAFFNCRKKKLIGPHRSRSFLESHEEDKFFSFCISDFSDSDVASLIAPRFFAVEAGAHDTSVDFEKSKAEFSRARKHYRRLGLADHIRWIPHQGGHISATGEAFNFLEQALTLNKSNRPDFTVIAAH